MTKILLSSLVSLSLLVGCGVSPTGTGHFKTAQPENFYAGMGLASDGTLHRGSSDLFDDQEFRQADSNKDGRLTKSEMESFFKTQEDPNLGLGDLPVDPVTIGVIGIGGGILAGYYAYTGNKISKEVLQPKRAAVTGSVGGTSVSISSDNLTLTASYMPSAVATDNAIVLCHQLGSSKEAMADQAGFLTRYNVLLLDFRNHGGSSSANSTGGSAESHDVLAAVAYLKGMGNKRVAALGVGMGGVAALAAAASGQSLAGVVTDNAYGALADDLSYRAKLHHYPLSAGVARAAIAIMGLRTHLKVADADALVSAAKIHDMPTLFIQAKDQPGLAPGTAQALQQAAPAPSLICVLPGQTQGSARAADASRYQQAVLDFLARAFCFK